MQLNLKGKSILLGVSGSISAYKACEVVRYFIKSEAKVHVVMSEAATQFITPLTFEALTRNPVLTQESESWSSDLNHIELGKKCDIFILAPATANTINKLSQGIADNLLLQTALAFGTKPLLIAPAANTHMLHYPATACNLQNLEANHTTIIHPQHKLLACGDKGEGALAEPLDIFFEGAKALLSDPYWEGREVVVTGGGTREKIDEVRYIGNFSSGKMANSLALALYVKGATVHYITTQEKPILPHTLHSISVDNTETLLHATNEGIQHAKKSDKRPFLFMVAAVSDYRPTSPKSGKLKKSTLGQKWQLTLTQTQDILSTLNKENITTIAFKAEMDVQKGLQSAINLLENKKVDGVCYNLLSDAKSFGSEVSEITFITKEKQIPLGKHTKLNLAFHILEKASHLTP
jgi:phosphopantothenoylcysteine decarboxylase/phosphopantothenate--cysteine ligase